MIFVAFGHEKLVGKDTAGKFLCSYLRTQTRNKSIQTHSFAYKLKDVCHQLYGWAGVHTPEFYEVEEHKKYKDIVLPKIGKTPRQIWIEFGTLVGRNVYPETWIEYLWQNVSCDVMIVTDMRFREEALRVLQYGGFCVKINNPRVPHTSDAADDPLLDFEHWTEEIINDGTLRDFNRKIVTFANEMVIPKMNGEYIYRENSQE